jgi:hypothetical protein
VGADDFVDKPFDTQQLIDKVSALLRRLATGASTAATAPVGIVHGFGAAAPPMAARPAAVDAGVRQRTQTLAYGQTNPLGGGPVAPVIPPPVAPTASPPLASAAPAARPAPVPQSSPVAAPPPKPVAVAAPVPAPVAAPVAVPAPSPAAPAVAARAISAGNGAEFTQKLAAIGLTAEQVSAVLALSREVVEKVVWEVVPTLAETMIKEEIKRLTAE